MIAAPPPDHAIKHRKNMWAIRLISAGILVVGILIGIVPLGWDLYVDSWPTANGFVTSSNVVRNSRANGKVDYTVIINYAYRVEGRDYTGSDSRTVSTVTRPSSPNQESPVTVHYHPAVPWLSNLDSSISLSGLFMGCCCVFPFGLLFMAISFVLKPQK